MARQGRANRPRLRLLSTVLLTVAILVLPTAVYAWGRTSSSFLIRRVEVTGTRIVPQRRAERLLRRAFIGHNLFTVTSKDAQRTLAMLPYVEGASVDRAFPDVLRVKILEHRPVAYALSGGRWFVIADDGYVICEVKAPAVQAGPRKAPGTAASGTRSGTAATPAAGTAATPAAGTTATPAAGTPATGSGAVTTATPAASSAATGTPSPDPAAAALDGPSATTTPAPSATPDSKEARQLATLLSGPPARPAALPLPRIAVGAAVKAGSTVNDAASRQALALIARLPDIAKADLAVVQVSPEGEATLRFAGGPAVTWGDSQRAVAKTLALRAVLDRYRSAGKVCTFMDVSIPDRVLARPILK